MQVVVTDDLRELGDQGSLKDLQVDGTRNGLQKDQAGFLHCEKDGIKYVNLLFLALNKYTYCRDN